MNLFPALYMLGRPLGPVYGKIMELRKWLYDKNILKSYALPVPVISIGNLTLGGTGKTPTVQAISDYLLRAGFKPAVISRGYGGSAKKTVNIVSDGENILLGPTEAGDEPYMLAASIPGLIVLTGTRRIHPCRHACHKMGCNVILLDDGYQHLSVKRDLDLVLFNSASQLDNGRIFPGGILREPFSALTRADALLFTGCTTDHPALSPTLTHAISKHCKSIPTFYSQNHIRGIFAMDGKPLPQPSPHTRFRAFSGIANPKRFAASLQQCGIQFSSHETLQDHAVYTKELIENLIKKARKNGETALITTEKDWVKIRTFSCSYPIYYLSIRSTLSPDFFSFLLTILSSCKENYPKA